MVIGSNWRMWASIPLPLACKASALPYELIPRKKYIDIFFLQFKRTLTVIIILIIEVVYEMSYLGKLDLFCLGFDTFIPNKLINQFGFCISMPVITTLVYRGISMSLAKYFRTFTVTNTNINNR